MLVRASVATLAGILCTTGASTVITACDSGSGGTTAASGPQDPAPERQRPEMTADEEQEVQRLLKASIEGRPMIRGQAARRLMGLGEVADWAILERAGETNEDFAALGREMIEAIGISKDPELRSRLWRAADDLDFAWRPAAVSGISLRPLPEERERIQPFLSDKLGAVRFAAINAWSRLDGDSEVLRPLLADSEDKIRQQAAFVLAEAGEQDALWWLFEELHRTDHFFDTPTGFQARLMASRQVGALTQAFDLEGYDASRLPTHEKNAPVLERLRNEIEKAAGERPELPTTAVAGVPIEGERIGIAVRSCREGEHFLRWTDDDKLLVGQGNPAIVDLEEGTVAGLVGTAKSAHAGTNEQVRWGEVIGGCDLEQVFIVLEPGERPKTLNMMKGPEPVPDLRPEVLDPLAVRLVRTLPDDEADDPRLNRLRSRVTTALNAVGGAFE